MEYVGKVGETLDFVCRKDKKVFQTTEPDLEDNVLTIVCKPDKYYTVPSSGVSALHISQYEVVFTILQNWPVCKAQCEPEKIKLPGNDTKLMLWDLHPDMVGTLDKKFWEDQKLWYKCIDEKNEGIIVEKGSKVRLTGQVRQI